MRCDGEWDAVWSGVCGVMGSGVQCEVGCAVWSGGVRCDGEWDAVWSGVCGVMGSGVQCGEVICSI